VSSVRPFVIAACGLDFEARLAHGQGSVVACCGQGARLRDALEAAFGPGCQGIISFGLAGGLDPEFPPGTLVVASAVVAGNGPLATDSAWSQSLLKACPLAIPTLICGVDAPVSDPAEKESLFHSTGAAAADMESHIAADFAAKRGLPFAALRAIADPAHRRVPQAALKGMRDDGSIDALAVLRGLGREPRETGALLRVARDALAARRALTRARHRLGRGFGLADLV
jgi:hopanoid-associated phosphorylase